MAMRVDLDPMDRADLLGVVKAMRERDRREIFACRPCNDEEALTDEILACQSLALLSGLIRDDRGAGIGYFGVFGRTPGAADCALFATDRWREVSGPFTRWVFREALPALRSVGVRRLEARSMASHGDARRWLTGLGAHRECVLPAFGRNGETFVQYALILDP